MKSDVRVFADGDELSLRAAETTVRIINESVRNNGSFSIALSGGNTPRTLYRLLSTRFRDQIPWTKVHVFWGDERYVPLGDRRSNYRMARELCWMRFRVRPKMCIRCRRNCPIPI
jgi:6-phosphogluconolactonase